VGDGWEGEMMNGRMKRGGNEEVFKCRSQEGKQDRAEQKMIKPGEGQVGLGLGSSWKGNEERARLWFCLESWLPFARVTSS
jgi:hypothetical protein